MSQPTSTTALLSKAPVASSATVTRRQLLAACAWPATLPACGTAPARPRIEHRVQGPAGRRPLVVFQSGLGDGLAVWRDVQSSLPSTVTSVAFSRPGYGASAWVDGGRSPCDVARLTRDFLRAGGFEPPYVLVGHSLGGLYQYAFACRHPAEVAGLVLLDPTHPRHWASVQRDVPALAIVVKTARAAAFSTAMRREFDDQSLCNEALEAARPLAMPARLLLRERFIGLESGAFEQVVHALEGDWSRRLGGAAATRVAGAGHYVQRDRPRVVSEAIAEVAAATGK